MRLLLLVSLLVGCGTEDGALLTVRAPAGPVGAARLEIVLASADPETITTIEGQRVAPGDLTGRETVRYYRQRATGGEIDDVTALDGFTVRIEPNVLMVPEQTFIPFLVAYDDDENVVGVGAVHDLEGEPTTILIEGGIARQYFVDMVPLAAMDLAAGLGAGQSLHVRCGADAARWTSGIAWRDDATQRRLLLADRSEDAAATDATGRVADLDCDGHVAPDQDCDDLRSTFHVDRLDVCDGVDSNCDGQRMIVRTCADTTCAGGGVELCDDTTGQATTTCAPTPACECENNGTCNRCQLVYRATADANRQAPCAPAIGKLHLLACSEAAPCTIDVLPPLGPWKAYVAATVDGPFGNRLANHRSTEIFLEAKLAGSFDVPGIAGASVGAVYLLVTQNLQSVVVGIDLQLFGNDAVDTCPELVPGAGVYQMSCTP